MPKLNSVDSAALGRTWKDIQAALVGGITLDISPATANQAATASGWTQDTVISLQDSDNNVLEFFDGVSFATTLSIADTSTAGTASIDSTTLTLTKGKATITVTGDAASWIATEDATLTVANITIAGFTVTGGTFVVTIV